MASPDLGAVAENAQGAGQRRGRGRQPGQAKQHGVGDAAGDDRGELPGLGGDGGDASSGRLAEQLADEERVTAGHLETSANEPLVRLAGQPVGYQSSDCRLRQRRGTEQLHRGIADQGRRFGRHRGLGRTGRDDQPKWLALDPARDEGQRARR